MDQTEVQKKWRVAWIHALVTAVSLLILLILGLILHLWIHTMVVAYIHLLVGISALLTGFLTLRHLQDLKRKLY